MPTDRNAKRAWSYVIDEPTRILFADDDVILTEFAKVHLSTPVATVEAAHDGATAWAMLQAGSFDVVLVDIEMPVLDGLTLVQRIRADPRLCHMPVIMVTGREDVVSIDNAFEVGATAFATKPVNWRRLSHEIRYTMRNSRMEAEIREARDRAEQLCTLKANLLGAIRHEFRTPLSTILGFSELMRSRISAGETDPATLADPAEHIHEAGSRLLGTFNDMMRYAQLLAEDFAVREAEYALDRLVWASLSSMVPPIGPGGPIDVSIETPDLQIMCDRDLITSALRHLVQNALFHGAGQDCRLTAGRSAAGEVVFEVSDRGDGIPPDRLASCLEAFEQSDMSRTRANGGLGLGLPIAIRVAKLHNGRLDLANRADGGFTARLVLPASVVIDEEVVVPTSDIAYAVDRTAQLTAA